MQLIGLAVVLAVSLLLTPPLAAAQQTPTIAKIGVFFTSTPAVTAHNLEAFKKGLREQGHVEEQPLSCCLAMASPEPNGCPRSRESW